MVLELWTSNLYIIFKKNPSSIRQRLLTIKQNATTFTRNILNKNCNQFCEISQLTEVKSCFQQWAHANIHAQKKIRQRNRKCSHYAEDSVLKYLILEYKSTVLPSQAILYQSTALFSLFGNWLCFLFSSDRDIRAFDPIQTY